MDRRWMWGGVGFATEMHMHVQCLSRLPLCVHLCARMHSTVYGVHCYAVSCRTGGLLCKHN